MSYHDFIFDFLTERVEVETILYKFMEARTTQIYTVLHYGVHMNRAYLTSINILYMTVVVVKSRSQNIFK